MIMISMMLHIAVIHAQVQAQAAAIPLSED